MNIYKTKPPCASVGPNTTPPLALRCCEGIPPWPDGRGEGGDVGVAVLPQRRPDLQAVLKTEVLEVRLLQGVQQGREQVDKHLRRLCGKG